MIIPRRSVLGAWAQTAISAWLDSVPTVPVLQNDQYRLPVHCGGASRQKSFSYVTFDTESEKTGRTLHDRGSGRD